MGTPFTYAEVKPQKLETTSTLVYVVNNSNTPGLIAGVFTEPRLAIESQGFDYIEGKDTFPEYDTTVLSLSTTTLISRK